MPSRASLLFPLTRNPSQISLFLCLFSSLEAPLTASKVCSQPHVDLGILGPCVCYGYTPAAAMAHAHVWILCEQTCHVPMCPPPTERPSRGQGLPRYVSTFQSLSGNRPCNSGSRHGNHRALVPSSAISAGTWPPAGLPGDLFPMMGGWGGGS